MKLPILKKIYQALPLKKELFQLIRSVYTPPDYIYRHLFFKGHFDVELEKGISFKMNHYNTHGYTIEDDFFWLGIKNNEREKVSLKLWAEFSKSATVIFDIGANTGIFTLISKAVNPMSEMHSFEPIERTFIKLQNNCELNKFEVQCNKLALSNNTGEATIYDLPVVNLYSATLNKSFSDNHHGVQGQIPIKIKTSTLSDYVKQHSITHIDLMKIDVEMHELEVLEGMGEYLKQFQPVVFIEVLNDSIGSGIQKYFDDLGYLYFNINESSGPVLVDKIDKSQGYNYLLCKKEIALKSIFLSKYIV